MVAQYTKSKNFVSIVVYVHNDESYIKNFVLTIDDFMKQNFNSYEFIIVNNLSSDNTINFIKDIKSKSNGKITIINLAWKHSKDACMTAGCDMAIGDFIFEFENPFIDYSTDEILSAYNKSLNGYDVVISVPKNKANLVEKTFYKLLKYTSKMNLSFSNERFKIVSRRAINRIYSNNNSDIYRKITYYYSGFNTCIYNYQPTTTFIYNEKMEFDTYINTLLQYTNLHSLLIYIYLFIMVTCFLTGNLQSYTFIGFGILIILLMLSIVIKSIKIYSNKNKDKICYVFKSIERL